MQLAYWTEGQSEGKLWKDWDWNSTTGMITPSWLLVWVITILALRSTLCTPRLGEFGCVHPFHSSLPVPMSHHEYNKLHDKIQIGIKQLEWSPHQAEFWVMGGKNFGIFEVPTYSHTKIGWVWMCAFISQQRACSNVSSWVDMINCNTRFRLELKNWNDHPSLIFWVMGGDNFGTEVPTLHTKLHWHHWLTIIILS